MINIFKKKSKKCKHKYKDFPWYITYEQHQYTYGTKYTVRIKEPYVCLLCGDRVDKTLSIRPNLSKLESEQYIKQLSKEYKNQIREAAVVEDMVNDCQLVDKSFLESYEYSQKITEDIMKSMCEDKTTPSGSDNKDLMELINEIKNNLQTTQKGN